MSDRGRRQAAAASVGRPPGSRVGPLLRADREAREALDDDVLARLGRQLGAQLLDRLAAVLVLVDVRLLEQHDLLEPLVDLALGGALARVLGDVVELARRDAELLGAGVLRDLLLGHIERLGGGDVQGDVADEGDEVLVARDEVGVAVDLDERADLAVGVDVGLHGALGGLAPGELGGAGDALLAQPRDRGVDVAAGLGQGLLAVHHPRAGQVAQGLDVLRRDVGHWESSLVLCSSFAAPVVCAGSSVAGAVSVGCTSPSGSAAGASRAASSLSASLVIGSPSSAGFSARSSPAVSRWRSVVSALCGTTGSGFGRPPCWTASATSASAS